MPYINYFAYGSNMDPLRMKHRGIYYYDTPQRAYLEDYIMKFNKYSGRPGIGYANIVEASGASVEGVLYAIDKEGLAALDSYEGYPHHYKRCIMNVNTGEETLKAIVYIAPHFMTERNLIPELWYLDHLIEGRAFLSKRYVDYLRTLRRSLSDPKNYSHLQKS